MKLVAPDVMNLATTFHLVNDNAVRLIPGDHDTVVTITTAR
jgi:hypothetical protein